MKKKCCQNKEPSNKLLQTLKFLKVISEKNRLKILCFLKENDQCVCDIWQYFNLAQNLVSHHLKVLKDFGLVSAKKKGLKITYSINKKELKKNLALLNNYFPLNID